MNKVYCEYCKHWETFIGSAVMGPHCSKKIGVVHTPTHQKDVFVNYTVFNKDNNCKHYEESWFEKLFQRKQWGVKAGFVIFTLMGLLLWGCIKIHIVFK